MQTRCLAACSAVLAFVALFFAPPVAAIDKAPAAPPAAKTKDYDAHVAALTKKLPNDDFTVVVEAPFVVIGDEKPAEVRRRARGTVRWAVEKLKAAYFKNDPAEIIDVWLFKDDDSYMTHCKKLFNTKPETPYGFCSYKDKALVMNISTGGGTLVHEIVHAYIAANFPACPSWFNEGLASLYEQSGEEDGEIRGYPNWRLPGLQKAIRNEKLVAFKELCGTTTDEFYNQDKGANYAQARYLCLYLQDKGLLKKYYRDFYAARNDDPSGYQTLVKTLGEKDMAAFKERWEKWALKLKR